MTDTPRLGLPVIEAAQAQKHVTHTKRWCCSMPDPARVESRTLAAPPLTRGRRLLYPAAGASGDWSGWDGRIALYSGGGWLNSRRCRA